MQFELPTTVAEGDAPTRTRSGRVVRQPQRYEPTEMPLDDYSDTETDDVVCGSAATRDDSDDDDESEDSDDGSDLQDFIVDDEESTDGSDGEPEEELFDSDADSEA